MHDFRSKIKLKTISGKRGRTPDAPFTLPPPP